MNKKSSKFYFVKDFGEDLTLEEAEQHLESALVPIRHLYSSKPIFGTMKIEDAEIAMDRYEFGEGMSEISGLGGDYEEDCRKMLKVGLEYWDRHSNLNPKFWEYEGIYGIISGENEDAKALSKAVVDAVEDCTGAMHQAVIGTIFWVRKNGWDEYVKEMKKDVKNE